MGIFSSLGGRPSRMIATLALALTLGGCGAKELEEKNQQLQAQVQSQEMELGRLKRDLEVKDKRIQALTDQVAQSDAALAAVQLGVSDPADRILATLTTNKGDVVVELDWKNTPKTVQNFVGLAEGTRSFTDPNTGESVRRPFYDGLIFHRVIPGFMIQGGDPKGNGTGGPGYTFADEIVAGLTFEKAGLLAMANRGPDTNGSQFFITTGTPTHLNGKHTIFGKVVSGMDVVETISKVPTAGQDTPTEPVVMQKVTIARQKAGG